MRYLHALGLSRTHVIAAVLLLAVGITVAASVVAAISVANSRAQQQAPVAISFPSTIAYQGRLFDTAGDRVPDGDYVLTLSLFAVEMDGEPLWGEEQSVAVENSLFNTFLGLVTPLDAATFASADIWLEIAVEGEIMAPRQQMAAVPYAFNAFSLQGKTPEDLTPAIVNVGRQVFSLSGSPEYENLTSVSILSPGAGTLLVEGTGTVTINSSGSYVDLGISQDELGLPNWNYRAGTPPGDQTGPFSWPFAVSDVYQAVKGQTFTFYLKGRQLGNSGATVVEIGSFRVIYYPP